MKQPIAILATLVAALLPFAPANASPLIAGGNHANEDHSSETHANQSLSGILLSGSNFTSTSLKESLLVDARMDSAVLVLSDHGHANHRTRVG